MKIGNYDLEKEVLVVAEIGNNHEGSYAFAEEMVGVWKLNVPLKVDVKAGPNWAETEAV